MYNSKFTYMYDQNHYCVPEIGNYCLKVKDITLLDVYFTNAKTGADAVKQTDAPVNNAIQDPSGGGGSITSLLCCCSGRLCLYNWYSIHRIWIRILLIRCRRNWVVILCAAAAAAVGSSFLLAWNRIMMMMIGKFWSRLEWRCQGSLVGVLGIQPWW